MIRVLGTPSGAVLLPKLRAEAQTAWPKILGCNEVGPQVGFYFEDGDEPTQTAVNSLMAAHSSTPLPPTAEEAAFAAAVTQLRATFNTTRTATQMNNSIDALTVLLRRIVREL